MEKIIEVKKVKKYFQMGGKIFQKKLLLKAVDGVEFDIYKGETLGVVGESGSGKSTLGKCITNIYPVTEGEIYYKGKLVNTNKKIKDEKIKNIQAVFQDPYSSLNPKLNIYEIVSEPLKINTKYTNEQIKQRVLKVLEMVGISEKSLMKKPYEFSGGQRQRVSIARAISTYPEFILCDEPISALDVSIQAQIVNLLEYVQKELKLTYLFIAHNLKMVSHISDRIMVMYLGNIVEIGKSEDIYQNPLHPYTKGLLKSQLEILPKTKENRYIETISMDIPSPLNIPKGCPFNTRCEKCMEKCKEKKPELIDVGNEKKVACFLYQKDNK